MTLLLLRGSGTGSGSVFLIWLGLIAAFLVGNYLFEQKRKKGLAEAAATIGFVPADDVPILCEMPLFERTSEIENIYSGNFLGYDATFFDVRVGRGKGSYYETIAGFRRAGLVMPPFELHNTNLGDRIVRPFSGGIVQIDSDPNFSSRYTLSSVDRDGVTNFFSPEVANYFSQLPPHKWMVQAAGDSVIIFQSRKRISPSKITAFLNDAGNVAAGFLSMLRPTSVF